MLIRLNAVLLALQWFVIATEPQGVAGPWRGGVKQEGG